MRGQVHKNISYIPPVEERVERKISAAASISMCALTVLVQIVTSLLISFLLAEYSRRADLVKRWYHKPAVPPHTGSGEA